MKRYRNKQTRVQKIKSIFSHRQLKLLLSVIDKDYFNEFYIGEIEKVRTMFYLDFLTIDSYGRYLKLLKKICDREIISIK